MSAASSPAKIACPHCAGTMKSPGLPPGSKVNCPKCGQAFVLGGGPQPPAVAPEPKKAAPAPSNPQVLPGASTARRPSSGAQAAAPLKPLGPMDAVPADELSAAMATQPAHLPPKPDLLVDPNLLPPPKPKPKPKPTEVVVTCRLCGTRMSVALAKVGEMIKCPDCHTVNEIAAPKAPPEKKATGPTLDDVTDFGMSEVVERPKYRPLVVPRGEDAILGDLAGADHPPGWTPPAAALIFDPPPRDIDPEITLAAPVERVVLKPELSKTYYQPDEREDKLTDGRYDDDDLIGAGGIDRKSPDAWKKAPFLIGLVEFLFYPSTLGYWIFYSFGAACVHVLSNTAVDFAFDPSPMKQGAAIFLFMFGGLSLGLFLAPFSAACLAIVQDTANGNQTVDSWPDGNFTEWFLSALYIPAAAILTAIPGALLTSFLLVGGMPLIAAPLPIVLCWTLIFPLVLFSMLAEGSLLAVYSPHTYRSLHVASDGWLLFYLYALVLGFFGAISSVMGGVDSWIVNALGGVGDVTVVFLYCRLLGRLMWYSSEKELKASRRRPD